MTGGNRQRLAVAAGMLVAAIAAADVTASSAARAQSSHTAAPAGIQSMMPGSQNQDLPIQIDAATLDVHDKEHMATFSGDVQVVQGDTTLKCQKLVVFYGGDKRGQPARDATAAPQAQGGLPQGSQNISRIEARGGVTVATKDQNASGDLGVYDLKAKTITLTGNVVVSQGKNVVRGDRVVVDTTTGFARVESGTATPSRVRALIQPGKNDKGVPSNMMSFGVAPPN
jgi:lipopolysaccharide export system protein LptA